MSCFLLPSYSVDNYLITSIFSPTEDEEVKGGQEDSSDKDDAIKEKISDDAAESIPGGTIFTVC